MSFRMQLIEVALPLEAINRESACQQFFEARRRKALDRTVLELAERVE